MFQVAREEFTPRTKVVTDTVSKENAIRSIVRSAVMSSEGDGATGRSTTYWKALLTLCYWLFETSTIEIASQDKCRCSSTGCSIYSP